MALVVMARKAYGEPAKADYPNLAPKAKLSVFERARLQPLRSHSNLHPPGRTITVPSSTFYSQLEDQPS